jgi:glycosyltransferase involved in cell wall biosynthesis
MFTAVGHRPSARARDAIARAGDGARLAGSVADVRPFFAAATVCVIPLRFGRGVKNKVLEAMAMGVPVVATSIAALGLSVRDGIHLLVADDADRFADAVVALAENPDRRRALADDALQYVRRSHTWDHVLRELPP